MSQSVCVWLRLKHASSAIMIISLAALTELTPKLQARTGASTNCSAPVVRMEGVTIKGTTMKLNLDVDAPDKVATVLRHAADVFREADTELASRWGDPDAGRIWSTIARRLDTVADTIDRDVDRWLKGRG
jgi:hypothetical protein